MSDGVKYWWMHAVVISPAKFKDLAVAQFKIIEELSDAFKNAEDPYIRARLQMLLKLMYMSMGELMCIATLVEIGSEKVYC